MDATLILDTSTERGVVALAEGFSILSSHLLPFGNKSSNFLLPEIQKLFKAVGITPADLKAVAVAQGPGSFTGIRVGAATAKAIARACKIPLTGFCTLEGFVSPEAGRFASVIDARIGGVYCLLQERTSEGEIRRIGQPELCSFQEIPFKLEEGILVVGPSFERLQFKKYLETAPDPSQIARLVVNQLEKGRFSLDGELELLYLRST